MLARLTFFGVNPQDAEELKKTYNEEIVPVIRAQKGNMGAWLLEPKDENDDYISLTEWLTQEDAEAYETSGTYRELVGKAANRFRSAPVLKTYSAVDSKIVHPA
ncbi:MAG TPA: antibiotic biosynthesis monooxygenase [Puia sp.]|nr:antibiotic biosynthesis monooxygenase [Puia sp.]